MRCRTRHPIGHAMWGKLFRWLQMRHETPSSFTVDVVHDRVPDGAVVELTEDLIKGEDSTWKPPKGAVRDKWRPKSTLD